MQKTDCPSCRGIAPADYMAVWEAMLEIRRRNNHERLEQLRGVGGEETHGVVMNVLWDRIGTAAMRDVAEQVTHDAVTGFEALPEDDQDGFDWDFVPAFLSKLDWAKYDG